MEDELRFGNGLDVGLDCGVGLVSWGDRWREGRKGCTCAPGANGSKHGGGGFVLVVIGVALDVGCVVGRARATPFITTRVIACA